MKEEDWVAVIYDDEWWPGNACIIQCVVEKSYFINFMKHVGLHGQEFQMNQKLSRVVFGQQLPNLIFL